MKLKQLKAQQQAADAPEEEVAEVPAGVEGEEEGSSQAAAAPETPESPEVEPLAEAPKTEEPVAVETPPKEAEEPQKKAEEAKEQPVAPSQAQEPAKPHSEQCKEHHDMQASHGHSGNCFSALLPGLLSVRQRFGGCKSTRASLAPALPSQVFGLFGKKSEQEKKEEEKA